jgi:hypothetical protein
MDIALQSFVLIKYWMALKLSPPVQIDM